MLLGGVMDIFQLPLDEMRRRGNFLALMFFVLGIGCLVVYFSLGWLTNIVAQTLNQRFRKNMLDSMLRQDVQFFDRAENTVGALTGRLDSYTQAVLELMGFNISLVFITMISVTASSILAIVVSWRLGLVGVFAGIPPLLVAGYARIRLETRMDDGNSKRFSRSASVASEAVTAIRTVSSLAIEHSVLERYTDELDHAIRQSMLPLFHMMFWFSFTQAIEYFILALGFWYGCKLVSEGSVTFYQFFVSFMGVFFAGQNASQMFAYTTSMYRGTLERYIANNSQASPREQAQQTTISGLLAYNRGSSKRRKTPRTARPMTSKKLSLTKSSSPTLSGPDTRSCEELISVSSGGNLWLLLVLLAAEKAQ